MIPALLSLALLFAVPPAAQSQSPVQAPSTSARTATSPALLPPDQVEKLLPPTVYFRGQSAPVQLRNAGAIRFNDGAITFAALVDTSGYSSSVRERYQFYLVTEAPLLIADKSLPAGAYGAGFLEDGTFVVMDIGGHDVLLSRTLRDEAFRRPRPLQIIAGGAPGELRLYLGRSYVAFHRP